MCRPLCPMARLYARHAKRRGHSEKTHDDLIWHLAHPAAAMPGTALSHAQPLVALGQLRYDFTKQIGVFQPTYVLSTSRSAVIISLVKWYAVTGGAGF